MKSVFALALGLGLASLALAGCASAPPAQAWKPRPDANLSGDLAACKKDAAAVDLHAPETSKYSAVVAMASRTDEVDLTHSSVDRMYEAIMYQCMTEKGWTPAP